MYLLRFHVDVLLPPLPRSACPLRDVDMVACRNIILYCRPRDRSLRPDGHGNSLC
jgi:hypothetical protein